MTDTERLQRRLYAKGTAAREPVTLSQGAYENLTELKARTEDLVGKRLSTSIIVRRALEVYLRGFLRIDTGNLDAERRVLLTHARSGRRPVTG